MATPRSTCRSPRTAAYTLTARDRDEVFAPEPPRPTRTACASPARAQGQLRARLSRLWYADNIQKPTREELEEAHHHAEHEHEHDAPLEGHAADGHQFDGRHDVDSEHMSRHQ